MGGQEMRPAENLLVYSFIIKGEVGKGRRPALSFLSRHQVFIINSFSRLSRGVRLSVRVRLGPQITVFLRAQKACPRDH